MHYLLLVYIDATLLQQISPQEYDTCMRQCLQDADALRQSGTLQATSRLEPAQQARSVRVRDGQAMVMDGPFADTKEVLAGFQLIQADTIEQAIAIAKRIPWAATGCIEVRPVSSDAAERERLGLPPNRPQTAPA